MHTPVRSTRASIAAARALALAPRPRPPLHSHVRMLAINGCHRCVSVVPSPAVASRGCTALHARVTCIHVAPVSAWSQCRETQPPAAVLLPHGMWCGLAFEPTWLLPVLEGVIESGSCLLK